MWTMNGISEEQDECPDLGAAVVAAARAVCDAQDVVDSKRPNWLPDDLLRLTRAMADLRLKLNRYYAVVASGTK